MKTCTLFLKPLQHTHCSSKVYHIMLPPNFMNLSSV